MSTCRDLSQTWRARSIVHSQGPVLVTSHTVRPVSSRVCRWYGPGGCVDRSVAAPGALACHPLYA